MAYKTSKGWLISTRKLKTDDRQLIMGDEWESETQRTEFIDQCVETYLSSWGIDLIDTERTVNSLKKKGN
jgi:hypothetical protein